MSGAGHPHPPPGAHEPPSPPPRPPGEVEVDLDVGPGSAPVDGVRWAALLARVLSAEGVAPGARVGLTFVGVDTMAELNDAHMGASGPTDVLAFPVDGLGADGDGGPGPPGVVGDVVICPAVAAEAAPGHAGSPDDELALLVVHGALHLLGHDHAEAGERARMQARERALLGQHHGPLARDPWSGRP